MNFTIISGNCCLRSYYALIGKSRLDEIFRDGKPTSKSGFRDSGMRPRSSIASQSWFQSFNVELGRIKFREALATLLDTV